MYGNKIKDSDGFWKYSENIHPFGLDASGRSRVSQLTTLADLKTLDEDDALMLENVGTGTGLFSNNTYSMSVTSGQFPVVQ